MEGKFVCVAASLVLADQRVDVQVKLGLRQKGQINKCFDYADVLARTLMMDRMEKSMLAMGREGRQATRPRESSTQLEKGTMKILRLQYH